MSRERAYATCLEMLQQRGYSIIEEEDTHITALKPDGQQMAVFFHDAPKFGTKGMKEIISLMNEMQVLHSLVVYKEDVTPFTKATLSRSEERHFEIFAIEDLQYNITKHRLQPTFERLEEKEATEFKQKYGMKFGTLRLDRPIARFYDYKRGDVIRITRLDGYINYRIVKG
jgi:DNA-directed RNA polymerase subunit H (RpoH/RPB5)